MDRPSRRTAPTPYISNKAQQLVKTSRSPTSPSSPKNGRPIPVPKSVRESFVAASRSGDVKALNSLLEDYDCSAFINAGETLSTGTDGWRVLSYTALHYAAFEGNDECIALLVRHGADACGSADFGLTPLMLCCEEGWPECARILLQVPSVAHSIDQGDVYGKSAFNLAAHHGNIECLEVLVEYGASVNSRDHHGRNPIHAAARRAENEDALRYLVTIAEVDINRPDSFGHTALDSTPRGSLLERILLDAGAKLTADDNVIEEICFAAFHGENDLMRETMQTWECRGVIDKVDEAWTDWHRIGFSALQYAAIAGNVEGLELLLEQGASAAVANDEEGNAPFLLGAIWGHCDVLTCLKRHGVDVGVTNKHGHNAVFCAVSSHRRECLRLLLEKDEYDPLDFNRTENGMGMSPLHLACRDSAEHLIALLLSAGAQVNLQDNAGHTPLSYCSTESCRRLLRQVGGV